MNSETRGDGVSERREILDPRGEVTSENRTISRRLESLEGTTVGLLDNSKANADIFLETVKEILETEYGVKQTVYRRKAKSPIPADDLASQLHGQCDAVVNAYGDCGSCTSWCMYDSVDLEEQGTPVATINSEEFVKLGQSEARSLGMPGLPIVTVPHPVGGIPKSEVRKRARDVVEEIIYVLTTDADTLEGEYEDRYLDAGRELSDPELYCPLDI